MNTVKAACIQMDILHCEKEVNISKALLMAREALAKGADILVFPEVFSTGFCYEDMRNSAEPENGETVRKMCDFSREHQCILIFSLIEKKDIESGFNYYNLGLCIEDGEIAGTYRKTHPFKREKQYFSSGAEIHPIRLLKREITVGLQICYEIRFPEVARKLVLEGSDILVTIAEFPSPRGHIWKSLAIARSIENQIPHIACNRVGDDPYSSFFGGSIIIDAQGEVKTEACAMESVILAQIEFENTRKIRATIPVLEDRRPDLY